MIAVFMLKKILHVMFDYNLFCMIRCGSNGKATRTIDIENSLIQS